MKRKLMAFILVFTMLASLSPAVAADEMSAQPTVEEILSEYHQKAFEAQTRSETDAASTWSRRGGSAKTLEQETVDTLTAAGYEAYNVTADNYETLEDELNTDFAAMGLDPEGSYIVVIHGEDPGKTASANSRTSPHPELDQEDTLGGALYFDYIYNGMTYCMRYLTVTPTLYNGMCEQSRYIVQPQFLLENAVADMVDTALIAAVDKTGEKILEDAIPFGTIFSLAADWMTDDNYTEIPPGTVCIDAYSNWTCSLVQIWNEENRQWDTAQCSEYVNSYARSSWLRQFLGDSEPQWYDSEWYRITHYSSKYSDLEQRKTDAAQAYRQGLLGQDYVYQVDFFFGNEKGEITWGSEDEPLFSHMRGFNIPLYSFE